ncbi:hypothetical protein [Streptomyces sp. NPDC059759]|uniref:hypothetical protein n=1 Tax=Streptomyces sp. NPDC059759 TaxID=3346936 RepID=UPI00365D79BD
MHRTATALLAAALLLAGAAVGCGSSSDDKPETKPTPVVTVTATPSLSQAETKRQCSVAVAEAAPDWEDWNFDPGKWADDPRTPKVCLGLKDEEFPPRGNREFMSALLDGLDMADDPRASQ